VNIEFKRWCLHTKHECTEVTIKSDGIILSEDHLTDEDLCTIGFEFLTEGLRNKGRYEMLQALIDLGIISEDQIVEWVRELNERN